QGSSKRGRSADTGSAQMTSSNRHPRRGNALLLAHCAAFGDRPTAYARLQSEVGEQLARLLVDGLGGRYGPPRLVLAAGADEEERQKAADAADDERNAA